MANTDGLKAVEIGTRHLQDAMALVAGSGWNQCAADWRMMLKAGTAFGYEDRNGKLVASALVLPYGRGIGWISMVLVAIEHRRRGIATGLIELAVDKLESADLMPCLDASPAGEKVYLKQGFLAGFSFHRWYRGGTPGANLAGSGLTAADRATVRALDNCAFGSDRQSLLDDVMQRGARCIVAGNDTAFALSRAGRAAHQIGPIVASDETTALGLFDRLQSILGGPVIVDIPDRHAAMINAASVAGFTRQRPFRRMIRGNRNISEPEAMFALFGPELG